MKDLVALLESSGLLAAHEALQALHAGWHATDFGPADVADLLRIYPARVEHLATLAGPHAEQLRASTTEFVANLGNVTGAEIGWIRGPGPHQYLVVLSGPPTRVIGCMRVVSKLDVSEQAWDGLWNRAV
jgi:hypothetical protein